MNNIQNIENNNKIVNIFCFGSKFFLFSFVFIVFFICYQFSTKKSVWHAVELLSLSLKKQEKQMF